MTVVVRLPWTLVTLLDLSFFIVRVVYYWERVPQDQESVHLQLLQVPQHTGFIQVSFCFSSLQPHELPLVVVVAHETAHNCNLFCNAQNLRPRLVPVFRCLIWACNRCCSSNFFDELLVVLVWDVSSLWGFRAPWVWWIWIRSPRGSASCSRIRVCYARRRWIKDWPSPGILLLRIHRVLHTLTRGLRVTFGSETLVLRV